MQRTGAGSGFPHPELRDEFCHHFISDLMGIESPHDFSESFLRVAPRLSNSAGLGRGPEKPIFNEQVPPVVLRQVVCESRFSNIALGV